MRLRNRTKKKALRRNPGCLTPPNEDSGANPKPAHNLLPLLASSAARKLEGKSSEVFSNNSKTSNTYDYCKMFRSGHIFKDPNQEPAASGLSTKSTDAF